MDPSDTAAEAVDSSPPSSDVSASSDPVPGAAPPSDGVHESRDDVSTTRDTRFVSWTDLERVADEAADIDSIVRTELERVGHPTPVAERPALRENRPERPPRRRSTRTPSLLLPLAVLVAAIGVVAVVGRSRSSDTGADVDRSSSPSAVAETTPPSSPEPTPPSIEGILARLTISDRCWIRAVVDGQPVFTGTVTSGGRTFHADRSLLLTLGNAGGARVRVNGRAIPTGATGEVVDLSFVVRGDRLVQLPT